MELLRDNPIAAVIALCELGLWVLVGVGLSLRYLAGLRRASTVVLACIPLLDVALVVAVALDLHRGTPVSTIHGLGGVYLGTSVAFGPALVRWADVRFAHRFAGGPKPVKVPRRGPERLRHLWREWFRIVNAAAIASVTLLGLALVVADDAQAPTLYGWIGRCWTIVGIWFVAGPLWEHRPAGT
ncbi:hypothetical protein CLV71_103300 [Actinophytocola oryzae]|uniref:Membrane protein YmcC n=2 Tax=Actinophytocola oryzae TaxID=502181 RepID=A0A4R7VZR8_9PSEU|nr:hypothetical protein CLV71_103300 [Actinophytocola oryzae]